MAKKYKINLTIKANVKKVSANVFSKLNRFGSNKSFI